MSIFLLTFTLTTACNTPCSPCKVKSVIFIINQCSKFLYSSSYVYSDIDCPTCLLSSGSTVACSSITSTSQTCAISPLCISKTYFYQSSTFTIPALSQSQICLWSIDFSTSPYQDQQISLSYSSDKIGVLILMAYNLPYGLSTDRVNAHSSYIITKENYQSMQSLTITNTNYVTIIYYTLNEELNYSSVSVIWDSQTSGGANDLSKALTITALCLVSVFCMGCCGVLCRRLYKSSRHSTRVYDQAIGNFQNRSRVYEVLPDNSVIQEEDLQRFPKEVFKEDMVEVGERVCCICLEEFAEGAPVRKLPCKHLFHSKCIEQYFVGRSASSCPLCKNNPFAVGPLVN